MINKNKFIVWFEEVDKNDVGLVGGKGANLGEMTQAHFPIPYGFVITANAYHYFIRKANLVVPIKKILDNINYENSNELQEAGANIRHLILKAEIPSIIINNIFNHYHLLNSKEKKYLNNNFSFINDALLRLKTVLKNPYVAVRSSATAEDLPNASFAGQQETYLNIQGENSLILSVKRCWASLFTDRAIYYRRQMNFDHFKVGLAVVVQRMVESEKSGIAFSIDPLSNDKNKIIIEAIYGLGELIVGGKVTPDHYEVDKKSLLILKKNIGHQEKKLIRKTKINQIVSLSKKIGKEQKLRDDEIIKIALLVRDIEKHYYFPQDIEWAIEKNQVFIVQSRPITTLKSQTGTNIQLYQNKKDTHQPILTGNPASPGIAYGPVKIIFNPKEIYKINSGDILVSPFTNPDFVPAMKKAVAIVTEKGGRTSHAAIVSRELGIPAVVGAEYATKILKNEEIVTVNGTAGEIYKGKIVSNIKNLSNEEESVSLKTRTKIYVNLAEPENIDKISKKNVDGIGLLRAEFIIAQMGIHPQEFIKKNKQFLFINHLKNNLLKFVKAFNSRPVVYRATDFKTNEYRNLIGGEKYEPNEENPMLGFRGASRYINQKDLFQMELAVIKKIWDLGYRNLYLMIPFIRAPWELIKIKEIIKNEGLFIFSDFKLWIMVEVPYCALNLEEFIEIGIDGISIGTNDLTMMLLGVDRDNENISYLYDERYPGIVEVLKKIVKTAVKNKITVSICGQAASDYSEIVEPLIKEGITSLSVNPDAIDRTRKIVYQIEKNIK